jgi:hypothetical protein
MERKIVTMNASLEGKQRSRRTTALCVSSSCDGLKLTRLRGGGGAAYWPKGVHIGPKSDGNNLFLIWGGRGASASAGHY